MGGQEDIKISENNLFQIKSCQSHVQIENEDSASSLCETGNIHLLWGGKITNSYPNSGHQMGRDENLGSISLLEHERRRDSKDSQYCSNLNTPNNYPSMPNIPISKHPQMPNEAFDKSIISIVSLPKVSPIEETAAMGKSQFWKIRKTLLRQQKLFSAQLFELHRVLKVQQLLATSAHVEVEGTGVLTSRLEENLPIEVLEASLDSPVKGHVSPEYHQYSASTNVKVPQEETMSKEQSLHLNTPPSVIPIEPPPLVPYPTLCETEQVFKAGTMIGPPHMGPSFAPPQFQYFGAPTPPNGFCPLFTIPNPGIPFPIPMYQSWQVPSHPYVNLYGFLHPPSDAAQMGPLLGPTEAGLSFSKAASDSSSVIRPAPRAAIESTSLQESKATTTTTTTTTTTATTATTNNNDIYNKNEGSPRSGLQNNSKATTEGQVLLERVDNSGYQSRNEKRLKVFCGEEEKEVLPLFPTVPSHDGRAKGVEAAGENGRSKVIRAIPRSSLMASESAAIILLSIQQERRLKSVETN